MADIVQKVASAVKGAGITTVPAFIDGEDFYSQATFDVVNPTTGKVAHKCSSASVADATAAVEAAAKAFPAWAALTSSARRDILLKAAEVLQKRHDELQGYMLSETTDDPGWAAFNLSTMKSFLVDIAGRIPSATEGSIPTTQDPGTGALILKEPFGVVLGIAPWNAPYVLGTRAVAFPLAAGNTVVLKGSELSPRVMWGIASVFAEAGLPKGVLNFISAAPENASAVTEALVAHPEVKKINFTGSTAVGRIIGRLAGQHLKPVLLELGGKAPAIIWEDADLKAAAGACALGAFLNAGQVCMSTERIIVHRKIVPAFEKEFAAATEKFFSKDRDAPLLILQNGVDKARNLVRDAVKKGATTSGADVEVEEASKNRMRPIVVKGVKEGMDLYKTESFGPTVAIFEVDTEEEALRLANDTEYGLSSSVFTEDLRRGLRFARGIETGAVHLNSMSIHDEASLPHGGAKASGYGRFNTGSGIDEFLRTKTVTFKW